MVPILFIGDLQQRLWLLPALLRRPEQLVFLGDILDSYEYSDETHVRAMGTILSAVEAGRAKLLLGNHEASYLWSEQRSSGWSVGTDILMKRWWGRYQQLVDTFLWYPDHRVLVTHAGLSRQWWLEKELHPETLQIDLNEYSHRIQSWYFAVGRTRGGRAEVGGPLWCDFYTEFTPVPGIRQVFGHCKPRSAEPKYFKQEIVGERLRRSANGDWCIDVSDGNEVLRWEPESDTWTPVAIGI